MTMSFPMAVIASNLSPNADIIIDGENGFLFEAENSKDLATKIDTMLNSENNLDQIKIRAIADIDAKNSPDVIGMQYHQLLAKFQ
jgi:glycosyltransferase involved in cell wall biosynthesis